MKCNAVTIIFNIKGEIAEFLCKFYFQKCDLIFGKVGSQEVVLFLKFNSPCISSKLSHMLESGGIGIEKID